MPSTPVNRNLRSANRGTESEEQRAESINTTIETTQQRTETVGTTTGTSLSTTAEVHSESGTPITLQTEGGAATNMQQQEQTPEVQQVQPFIFNATALLQPSTYDGSSKPSSWISQFSSWTKLQNLTDKNAINALTFYLSGPAKIWFQSLPDSAKTNLASIIKLLEVRFTTSDDEDILTTQATNESVHEFLDRLTLKATSQRIPECLVLKIARKGFKQALQQSIIQQNPKTMAELREAAVIAEKCLASNFSQQISVNAISQNDFKSLSDTIKLLSDKVENLNIENQELKANFGKANQNYQNKPNWQNNNAPGRNFNGQRNFQKNSNFQQARPAYNTNARNSYNKTNTCTACGNMSCSGKRETCDARDKTCYKCERVGHYSRQCHSIRNIRGEIIRH
ncbi:uncharacterized protein LOC127724571 isoform X2 [Mytilus californianus]|uniref:uncharacterized protein LOC127724571 isoform X2 n=1 Tax=Mytilus californianus TaxID=6549 RepID=UPI00224733C4|nr:uncharacterized protein LOC127724571 isoform X2 [Mytilus californianus]